MPGDIRSFFGGKVPDKPMSQETSPPKKAPQKRGRPRKVVEDDEDDEAPPAKKATPKKASAKKRDPTPDGEETTAADYFGSSKSKKAGAKTSKPAKGSAIPQVEVTPKASPAKSTRSEAPGSSRSSRRGKQTVSYAVDDDDDDASFQPKENNDDDEDGGDDVFTAEYKNGKKGGDDYEEDEDMKDVADLEDEEPKSKKATPKNSRKRKSEAKDDEDVEEKPKKAKTQRKAKAKEDVAEDAEVQKVFDAIPTVRAPTPPPKETDGAGGKPKFSYGAQGHANSGPAPMAGSKELPTGAENCLAGLSFVFTGLLDSLSRDDGMNLVKRYGGRVVGAPSKKTDYVVLGNDAGPSKLHKIKELSIKTINEEGLFALVRTMPAHGGSGKAGDAYQKKQDKEEEKIQAAAAEAEKEEAKKAKAQRSSSTSQAPLGGARANEKAPINGPDQRLWTVKYAPTQMAQICGNKGQAEKLQNWLKKFPANQRKGFKLAGADGSGVYRAMMLHGPPGIGKTTAAHLVAKMEGYDIVESNASDSRSKKLVEAGLKGVLSTTSLMGYFAGDSSEVEASKRKMVLIMDEVDGMSSGDRGGVGALAAVCRKTQIPMILICNERKLPKMKPFDHVCYDLPFRRPTADQIRARIMTIAYREQMKIPPAVINALIEGSRADIRQVVNMVSQAKLDAEAEAEATGEPLGQALDFDKGQAMSRAWEKNAALKPFDLLNKIMDMKTWSASAKSSLNQKAELYFHDDISSLMVQESYLTMQHPTRAQGGSPQEQKLRKLALASRAADSISEGDLCDRMIRGGDQHWTLMPTHAILSFVRPASFMHGSLAGLQSGFPAFFGKLSTSGKLAREVKEVQGHMRLRANAEKNELRMQYLPLIWTKMVKRLQVEGKEALDDVIAMMDYYYLTKEDWDSIAELGVDYMDQEKLKIETATKAAFTRTYNQASHPMPFIKASQVQNPKKLPKEKPDVEEAFEESEEEILEEDVKDDEDQGTLEEQLGKDKYVKNPKAKKVTKGKGKGKAVAKDEDEGEDEKPKKGKGRAKK